MRAARRPTGLRLCSSDVTSGAECNSAAAGKPPLEVDAVPMGAMLGTTLMTAIVIAPPRRTSAVGP